MKLLEPQTLIILLVIALVIFGPKQLPALGKAFGKTAKEIKKGMTDLDEDVEATKKTVREIAEPAKPAAETVEGAAPEEAIAETPTEA